MFQGLDRQASARAARLATSHLGDSTFLELAAVPSRRRDCWPVAPPRESGQGRGCTEPRNLPQDRGQERAGPNRDTSYIFPALVRGAVAAGHLPASVWSTDV